MAEEELLKRAFVDIQSMPSRTSPGAAVTEDQLLTLYFLFNKNLEKALRILDFGGVTRVRGEPSGRTVFQVISESKGQTEYLCFPDHFCSCPSFYFEVVSRGQQLCCKHQLAARLATCLQIFRQTTVSDEELVFLLLRM